MNLYFSCEYVFGDIGIPIELSTINMFLDIYYTYSVLFQVLGSVAARVDNTNRKNNFLFK